MATLIVQGPGGNAKYILQSAKYTFGRGSEADIQIKDLKVSGTHCAIVKTTNGYAVKHLAPEGRTLVNGQPVKAVVLKSGDVIQVGDTSIKFQDGQAGATATVRKTTTVKRPGTGRMTPAPARSPTGRMTPAPARSPTGRMTPAPARSPTGKMTPAPGRAPTSRVQRKPTGPIAKPPTSRAARATQRRPQAGRRRPKGVNPYAMAGLLGVIALLFVGVYFLLTGFGESGEELVTQARAGLQAGIQLETGGRLEDAVSTLRAAEETARRAGDDMLASEIGIRVTQIEQKQAALADASSRVETMLGRRPDMDSKEEVEAWVRDARQFIDAVPADLRPLVPRMSELTSQQSAYDERARALESPQARLARMRQEATALREEGRFDAAIGKLEEASALCDRDPVNLSSLRTAVDREMEQTVGSRATAYVIDLIREANRMKNQGLVDEAVQRIENAQRNMTRVNEQAREYLETGLAGLRGT